MAGYSSSATSPSSGSFPLWLVVNGLALSLKKSRTVNGGGLRAARTILALPVCERGFDEPLDWAHPYVLLPPDVHVAGLLPFSYQETVRVGQQGAMLKEQPHAILLWENAAEVTAFRMPIAYAAPDGIGFFSGVRHGRADEFPQARSQGLHTGTMSKQDVLGANLISCAG